MQAVNSLPYDLVGPIGSKGLLALIVLQTDETIESEFKRWFPFPSTAVYITRIAMAENVTAETLTAMACDISASARLLPPSLAFDCIGYCCTSASAQIGSDNISTLVKAGANTRYVANPLSAVLAALTALKPGGRIAVITPYIPSVSQAIVDAIVACGFTVHCVESFNEVVDANVARINPESILNAVLKVGKQQQPSGLSADAVFVSCTNLRTIDIIPRAEAVLGIPVISSNLALAWYMNELAGQTPLNHTWGVLTTKRFTGGARTSLQQQVVTDAENADCDACSAATVNMNSVSVSSADILAVTPEQYCSMFLQGKALLTSQQQPSASALASSAPPRPSIQGVVGRFLRVVGDEPFTKLSDDPHKKLAWVCSEEMLSSVLGMTPVEALLYIGKPLGWLEKRLRDDSRHRLVVFPASEGTVATWDGVFDLVAEHFGDHVVSKLEPFRKDIKSMRDYSSFPNGGATVIHIGELPVHEKIAHPEFMSVERLLTVADADMDVFIARAFFHHSIGCNELFLGTGRNAGGDLEILVPNVPLSQIDGLHYAPLSYTLEELRTHQQRPAQN